MDELQDQLAVDMYDKERDQWTLMCAFLLALDCCPSLSVSLLIPDRTLYTDVRLRVQARK